MLGIVHPPRRYIPAPRRSAVLTHTSKDSFLCVGSSENQLQRGEDDGWEQGRVKILKKNVEKDNKRKQKEEWEGFVPRVHNFGVWCWICNSLLECCSRVCSHFFYNFPCLTSVFLNWMAFFFMIVQLQISASSSIIITCVSLSCTYQSITCNSPYFTVLVRPVI